MSPHDWTHGTFLSPEAAALRPPRYRTKAKTSEQGPAAPIRHPHWFCAQLREIVAAHPEAHRAVCEWLARLEAEGHTFTS